MRPSRSIRAAGALAVLALALPASASAVPSVTSVVAKTGDPGVTYLTDPTGADLVSTQTRYVLSLDGWALGFVEDNGLAGGGVLDYSALPSDYRAPATAEQKLTFPAAQTNLQAHATCSDVASLRRERDDPRVAERRREPSYAYVPWQKSSAGLGDDPASWIAVVKKSDRCRPRDDRRSESRVRETRRQIPGPPTARRRSPTVWSPRRPDRCRRSSRR